MDNIQIKSDLIEQLIKISKEAGQAILEVYKTNFDHQIKEDLSPLTKADILSHNIICERLEALTPGIPILSEESCNIPLSIRSQWNQYWLIDPLDGTKEFLKKNDEFTVNIALMKNNKPIFGLINTPVSKEIYWGSQNHGSNFIDTEGNISKIKTSEKIGKSLRIVTSRSHPSEKLNTYLKKIDNYKIISRGSSLKFCLVASGKADIYPRFGPTSEWDIAAGEAIVKFAGGEIIKLDGKSMTYNLKDSLLNPEFIVSANKNISQKLLSLMK